MRIVFAVHDWGLGHAARSLSLIRALLDRGDDVIVVSAEGGGLQLLRQELASRCRFIAFPDIPKPFSRWPAMFYVRMSLATPQVLLRFRQEHRFIENLIRREHADCVVSDSRFGMWSEEVPSYGILHSLRQIIPGRPRHLELLVERGQFRLTRHFTRILIPDIETDGGLSGDLGHHPAIDWGHNRLCYIGPLSTISRQACMPDVDCFISISGIEPQRSLFTQQVLHAVPRLSGRVVVALGRPDSRECRQCGHAVIHGYLDRRTQAAMLNRAKVVVTRSGYTTLMELAQLGKRALFVPTRGQSEQEYLARFHHQQGHVWSTTQGLLDLPADIDHARARPGVPLVDSRQSVQHFLDIIDHPEPVSVTAASVAGASATRHH